MQNSSNSSSSHSLMELNAGHYLYPRVVHGLGSKFVGGMHDPVNPRFLSSINHGSGHDDAGKSFLALLHGPPALSHHDIDFQELFDRKLCTSSSNCTAASGNFVVNSREGGTFRPSTGGMITENLNNHNPQSWVDTFPDIFSRAMVGLSSCSNSVFHDIHSSNTAAQLTVPGGEKARESFSSRVQCCGTSPESSVNVCHSDVETTPNMFSGQCSSKQAIPFTSGCPRVFCMGKSGYLLLSNTGLLGIVCSCHSCHMSILKFCEHSGLYGVNPGDAVRMESGETVAQWQKLYFLKFHIRSPGNKSQWDWPEVLSTTGSLMKSNASAPSSLSKSDLSHILGSSAVTLRCGKPSAHSMLPNNAHIKHNLLDALSRKQPTAIRDFCNIPLKGFNGISQNSLYDQAKSQLMESNLAMYTTVTRAQDDRRPIPPVLDSLKRNRNLSMAHSPSQTPTSFLKHHEFIKSKNAKDGLLGRVAASSNIELRLGQPPQTGYPVSSFIEPPQFNAFPTPSKLQPLKQMINNADLSKEDFSCAAGSFKMVEEPPQLEPRNYVSDVSNSLGAGKVRLEIDNVAKGLSSSPFPQFNPQPQGKTKSSENLVNNGGPILPKKLHSEFSTMQFGSNNVLWNSSGHTGRQSNNSANDIFDNNRGASFTKDSCATINSAFGISQLMEYPSFMPRAVCGSDSCVSAVNGKINESHHESSLPFDTLVGANFLPVSKKVSSLGQDNQVISGTAIPFEGIPKGFPLLVSSSTSNQIPTFPQQQGINVDTYLLDENMRLLALTQILELSKQHALYFHEMCQKHGRSSNISKAQHYIHDASTSEQDTSRATLKLPQNGGICGNPEVTADSGQLASITGLYRHCCRSALAPIPLNSKEKESHCKSSYELQNEQPSLSLGINKDNNRSSECAKFTKQSSDLCCAAQVNCSGSNFFSGIGRSHHTFKQQIANASGETSLKMASKFSIDHNASKNVNIHLEQGVMLDGQNSIKVGSLAPQWRDVPNKIGKAVCDASSLDQTTVLDRERQDGVQLGSISAKRLKMTIDMEDSLKEQENSNVSSECSAPVVTQASVEVNKVDSCSVDAGDTGYVNNLVVDEGSRIDKGWSSDAVESGRNAEFLGSTCKSYSKKGYLKVLNDQPYDSVLDELKLLNSFTWKKDRDQNHIMLSVNCNANQAQKVKKALKGKKRKRNELRILDASLPSGIPFILHNNNGESTGVFNSPSSSKEMQMYLSSSQKKSSTKASFVEPSTKQRNSAFVPKIFSCKNHLGKHHSDKEDNYESESNSDTEFHTSPEVFGIKKLRKDLTSDIFGHFQMQEPACVGPENAKMKLFSCRKANPHRITKPVVYGKYGEICSGQLTGEVPKPAKIVSLRKVLKSCKRFIVPSNGKPRLTSKSKWKRLSFGVNCGRYSGQPGLNTEEDNETQNKVICNGTNSGISVEGSERINKPLDIYKGKRGTEAKLHDSIVFDAPVKLKSKENRKHRSIYELTANVTKVKNILEHAEDRDHGSNYRKSKKFVQEQTSFSILNSDAFCCVCRSSSNDEINCLLKCSQCLIRVHQACYGISTLPKKGHWCCRPCRTDSKDIACVLCGYGDGAMTRAILSHTIVRSLLQVWNIEKDGWPKHTASYEVFEKEIDDYHSLKSGLEADPKCVLRPANIETSTTDLLKVEMSTNHVQHTPYSVSNFTVHNSITAGVLDTNVKQWVHMVCGLWTPGTRCPNVDTMSSFDVSGVSPPRADLVCSICNRWGGSCIECRYIDCSVKFHPWCAHQKNLLQSETEGVNDEKVGFYATCVLHAINPVEKLGSAEEMEFTCARTEGYKGRKRDGFMHSRYGASKTKSGCLVAEEQLNAWIHINGQKVCSQGFPKIPASEIEHDCRKEYARYKQAKGWKHLVVYKSGIHALGLYTSRFISRGEMVAEYVGEIVGLRVADKRENEYQSGRKLQYKSACYFFGIDKEHIIDATRKGGIARFVNHSCLPNCVAKVITVRHEKKVVFFAERDIFPGEEITYDYHFNHEDEGKKIPCYCNSKNCRRYLN